MTSIKNTRILNNINCDELVLDTNNDAKNLHFNIRTTGSVGENDIEFKTCNVKVSDGDFHADVIKDLDGNEFVNLSGSNHVIKDTAGDPIMTIGDSSIDFHSATVNNLTLGTGSLTTDSVASQNYTGQTLEYELDTIATNITGKLAKDGQTANKILTTSSGGVIQFVNNSSLLTQISLNAANINSNDTDIANNTSSISTNTSNISSNTSSIGTNTTNISTNTSSISTNTTNIASNTGNVATALSNISTLDNIAVKLTETQTLTNKTLTSPIISTITNGSATLTLPTSTGTLALQSAVTEAQNTANANEDAIDLLDANKLNLTGGTLTGALIGTTLQMNGGQIGTVYMGSSATYNFQIDDAPISSPTETFAINFNTAFTPDAYFVGTTTATDVRLGSNNSTRLLLSSGGDITSNNKITISNSSTEQLRIQNSTANGGSKINIFGGTGGGGDAEIFMGQSSSYGGGIYYDASTDRFQFYRVDNGAFSNVMYIPYNANSLYIGDIHLGQTNEINIDSGMYLQDDGSGLTTDDCYICRNGGTLRVGGTIVPSSDDRLKHNEEDISGAINIIRQLTPKKYFKSSIPYEANNNFDIDSSGNYVDSSGNVVKGVFESGLIAQEVMETDLAFLVSGGGVREKTDASGNVIEEDLMYGVNYNGLHGYTIKAIQEQQEIIETLQKKLADEETKTAYFEMKINQLFSHLNL